MGAGEADLRARVPLLLHERALLAPLQRQDADVHRLLQQVFRWRAGRRFRCQAGLNRERAQARGGSLKLRLDVFNSKQTFCSDRFDRAGNHRACVSAGPKDPFKSKSQNNL